MKRFMVYSLLFGRFLLAFSVVMLSGCVAFAQPASMPQTKAPDSILQTVHVIVHEKQRSLAEIVRLFTPQIKRGIVVDGLPLLQKADIDVEGSAKEALDLVADTYDFTWSLSKHGIILLRKRFHHPDEYPQMNLPELRETAKDIVAILHAFPYDTNEGHLPDLIFQLYHSLTPEQEQRLREKGLAASDLTLPQQQIMQSAILTNAFAGACTQWERLLQRLDFVPKSYFQTRVWPFYYQQRKGDPLAPRADNPTELEFDLLAPGLFKSLPGDLPSEGTEMRIPIASRKLP